MSSVPSRWTETLAEPRRSWSFRRWRVVRITIFDRCIIGAVEIPAGGTATVSFPLAEIPSGVLAEFRERLQMTWTGYTDPDPEVDYLGFIVQLNGLPITVDFSPL